MLKKLILSLIGFVVSSVIALGFLINTIYYDGGYDEGQNPESIDEPQSPYILAGRIAAKQLDESISTDLLVAGLNGDPNAVFEVEESSTAVPENFLDKLKQGEPLLLETETANIVQFYMPNSEKVLTLTIKKSGQNNEQNDHYALMLTVFFYLGVVLILLVWLFPLIRSLVQLNSSAIAFGRGQLTTRIDTHRFSYIDNIECEFNRMADKINQLLEDNKLLSRAVSHNLKTPIARLRFGIDLIGDAPDEKTLKEYAHHLDSDLIHMEDLVQTLLDFSRLEESNIQLEFSQTNLNELVEEIVDSIALNSTKEIELKSVGDGDGDKFIRSDKRYLSMQIQNLVDNAEKYAKSKVRISILEQGKDVEVVVEDDGEGFPNNAQQLLQPFAKGENSTHIEGHGMGLAIISRIAFWLNNKLCITGSSSLGGARVSLTFHNRP